MVRIYIYMYIRGTAVVVLEPFQSIYDIREIHACVVHIQQFSFYPSTSSTPRVRADSSPYTEHVSRIKVGIHMFMFSRCTYILA